MNRLIYFLFCMSLLVSAEGQSNYEEAIRQGDSARDQRKFDIAINKYFAAEAFDPSKKDSVKKKVQITFDRIEALRQEATRLKKEADNALRRADLALEDAHEKTNYANEAREYSFKQKEIADSMRKDAVMQKQKADSMAELARKSLQDYKDLKATVIGSRYQGGIVISWVDSTGKHGVIAAEQDMGNFNWYEAKDTCNKLVLNGYDDWRLPDRTEIAVLYAARNVVGGFKKEYYWCANQAGILHIKAWCQLFSTGFLTGKNKKNKFLIRPVRSF
jgi:hypothetical protein